MLYHLATTLLLAETALSLTVPPFLTNPSQILLGASNPSSDSPSQQPISSSLPAEDSILCPATEAIMPIYGPPSQHHSYLTAVATFCRIDLTHIPHGAPNTNSLGPPSHAQNGDNLPSGKSTRVAIVPRAPLIRSYRVTLVADTDPDTTSSSSNTSTLARNSRRGSRGSSNNYNRLLANAPTHVPNAHQLSLEIRNENDHPITVSSEDCIASFMAIVDGANGCRVSDVLTKTGEYRAGSANERGLAGLVFRAAQWK